jgi:hypothetical protein
MRPPQFSRRTRLIVALTTPLVLAAGISGALVALHAGTSLARHANAIASCSRPSIRFGASSATPASLAAGATVTLATSFTASCRASGLVDFAVYNAAGGKVWTQRWGSQTMSGRAQSYSAHWTTPIGLAAGTYTFKVGIFSPGWTTRYAWNDRAASFQLSATTATPTATLPPTPGATPSPTSTPTSSGGTLPPGSPLPSEAACAAQVAPSTWEPRPDNTTANHSVPTAQQIAALQPWDPSIGMDQNSDRIRRQITGNYTGTTDQILQWVACKWGIDPDIVRAQAEQESYWHQSQLGDWTSDTSVCPSDGVFSNGGCYQSYGILQIKYRYFKTEWPMSRQDTAFNAEMVYGWIRNCYEGWADYLYQQTPTAGYPAYHPGDIWGCVGFWYSGSWYDQGAISYIAQVKTHYADKDWLKPGF